MSSYKVEDVPEVVKGDTLSLGWPDVIVVVMYFIFVLFIGFWSSRKSQRTTINGYFLASRSMHWMPVGASLYATNIGSEHFIGIAGSGAASGLAVAGYEFNGMFVYILLAWFFVPVYMSSGIYTMPEYLRERFGGQRIRIYLSVLAIIIYVFTKISVAIYAGALFIQLALNKSSPEWLYISIFILLAVAAVFTIAGGLTTVIWTDFAQLLVMVLGAFILLGMGVSKVGGFDSLVEKYPYSVARIRATGINNISCGAPDKDYMSLLRSISPDSYIPWTGIIFGQTINAIWYLCTDQVIVQRTLASKNVTHAKGGCILAAYVKSLSMWLLVFPGMISRILYPDRVACAHPDECQRICGNPRGCSNIAYIELVVRLLPQGLSGLMLAVMMAALMTSLTSIFNSASTIFTIDLWTRFRKKSTEFELLLVGRCFVVVLVAISIIWIPVIQKSGNSLLFDYIQGVSSFLAPPIAATYILAVFWSRTNEPGAFWGLMAGLVVGSIRFIFEFASSPPVCGLDMEDTRPKIIHLLVTNVHYLNFSCILFLITCFVTVSVSLLTEPISSECLYRLTYWSRKDIRVRKRLKGRGQEQHLVSKDKDEKEKQNDFDTRGEEERIEGREIDEHAEKKKQAEKEAESAAKFLDEDIFLKKFVGINAVICLTYSAFMWGFFA